MEVKTEESGACAVCFVCGSNIGRKKKKRMDNKEEDDRRRRRRRVNIKIEIIK